MFMALLLLAALPARLAASPLDFALLPTQAEFGCLACHAGATVTATVVPVNDATHLNGFGQDWLRLGRHWGPELAAANSDGDGCSNGYELGNPDGDWRPEDGYLPLSTVDPRNPGQSGDCLLPIGEQSFGILKGLFGER